MNELINLEQLSDRLNIGKPTIVKMIRGGSLPYIKIGRTYRFDYEAVIWKLSNTLNREYIKAKKKGNE